MRDARRDFDAACCYPSRASIAEKYLNFIFGRVDAVTPFNVVGHTSAELRDKIRNQASLKESHYYFIDE